MCRADCLLFVLHQGMSASRQLVDWKAVQGPFHKPRRLHLKCQTDELFHCPLPNCEHRGFASQRLSKAHQNKTSVVHIFFDTKPKISNNDETNADVKELSLSGSEPTLPCDVNCQFGRSFSAWLQSTTSGGKKAKQAKISVTRAFKFLKYCCEQSGKDKQSLLSTV